MFITQRLMTVLARYLAYHTNPTLKNRLIRHFFSRFPEASLMEAIEKDPFAYKSFYELFSRKLIPSARPIDHGHNHIIMPADGVLAAFGLIEEGQLIQAKGCEYSVEALLGSHKDALPFKDGLYATIYLRPTDYHRIHAPYDGTLTHTHHIPGFLYSVGHKQMNSIPGLLTKNERLACLFKTRLGDMAVTFVGATLVGSIETTWGGIIRPTWCRKDIHTERYPKHAPTITQGADMGHFHFGSTVVLLLNRTDVTFAPNLYPGIQVQFGQRLATIHQDS